MTEPQTPAPSRATYTPRERTAPLLAAGVVLLLLGLPAVLVFTGPLAWAGWAALAVAAGTLGAGVFRLADRADSRRS